MNNGLGVLFTGYVEKRNPHTGRCHAFSQYRQQLESVQACAQPRSPGLHLVVCAVRVTGTKKTKFLVLSHIGVHWFKVCVSIHNRGGALGFDA